MQSPGFSTARIRFGAFVLDVRTGELRKGTTRLKVPDQSIEVLKALLERPGEMVSREELRHRLWRDETFVDFEQGLNGIVRRLRDALGDSADAPTFIETLPRRGYRFIGVLEIPDTPQEGPLNGAPAAPAFESDAPNVPDLRPVARIRPFTLVLMFGVVAAAAAGVFVGFRVAHLSTAALKVVPVTTYAGRELDPSISPDGQQVAFAWDNDAGDKFDIYVKQIGRDERLQLTSDPAVERRPVWSPDGQRIAFLRLRENGRVAIVVVPALGGSEQPVAETSTPTGAGNGGLSWTPDGKGILYLDQVNRSFAVFVCWVDTGQRQQLTTPEADFSDASPVIAPDGSQLAFVRKFFGLLGGRVFVQPITNMRAGGNPRPLTADYTALALDWTPDGRSLIFGAPLGLWRVGTDGGAPELVYAGAGLVTPTLARRGHRLAFQHTTSDSNIWRIEGPSSTAWPSATRAVNIAGSTYTDSSPHISYDGRQVVYRSHRSGYPEIWVSRIDGSQPQQLTHADGRFVGSPRWSPNGEWVAFDSMQSGTFRIGVVGAHGGALTWVTKAGNSYRPSWSHDGRWIYFGSTQSGSHQIWKIRSDGKDDPIQLTKSGGFEPFESFDGHYVYYAKPRGTRGIWRIPVNGGQELKVLDRGMDGAWGLTKRGIVFMDALATPHASIEIYGFDSTLLNRTLLPAGLRFDSDNPSFSVSPDGAWIVFTQVDSWGSDIEMIDGFR